MEYTEYAEKGRIMFLTQSRDAPATKSSPCHEIANDRFFRALLRNPKLTVPKLGELLGMTSRQAERIIASLKKKVCLKR